jgi:hypothetical protein
MQEKIIEERIEVQNRRKREGHIYMPKALDF